jgi:hypothetical protein
VALLDERRVATVSPVSLGVESRSTFSTRD